MAFEAIGIGGDPIVGTTHVDALRLFQDDSETDGIVMIVRLGGTAAEKAAAFAKENVTRRSLQLCAIAGQTAAPGSQLVSPAIIAGEGTAAGERAALEGARYPRSESPGRH